MSPCLPTTFENCLPSIPQVGNEGTHGEESETRTAGAALHYFLSSFDSVLWSLQQLTEEFVLSHRRKADIIWWLATTKKC